ncbi:MAG TPA: hypothetical protein VLY87_01630 [Flavobacterium sp.]|nr:hypothetical protein [Flavobacterium sp.]
MKRKSTLIPKSKMWISLILIFFPILVLILLKLTGVFKGDLDFNKLLKITASIAHLGMFLLFMTKWTKDDGDEMYLKFRLTACLQGIIFVTGFLFLMSIFALFDTEYIDYSAHIIISMLLTWMLYILGTSIYKANKELKNEE